MKFASAYQQLQPSERDFVDGVLRLIDIEATKHFERMTATLERFEAALDVEALDSRSRDQFAKPMVQAAIRECVEDLARERDLTPERIIREHAMIGLANMGDYIDVYEDGTASPNLKKVPPAMLAALQQVEFEETYGPRGTTRKMKLKLYNKQVSLDAIAKWNGLDKPDNAEFLAYRALPSSSAAIPAAADVATAAELYARQLDAV